MICQALGQMRLFQGKSNLNILSCILLISLKYFRDCMTAISFVFFSYPGPCVFDISKSVSRLTVAGTHNMSDFIETLAEMC